MILIEIEGIIEGKITRWPTIQGRQFVIFCVLPSWARTWVSSVVAEQHDEWQFCRRYFSTESLTKLCRGGEPEPLAVLLPAR